MFLLFNSGYFLLFLKQNPNCLISPNEDSGARYCAESLLTQRSCESTQLTFLLNQYSRRKEPVHTECPSFLLPVHLSLPPPDLLSLYGTFLSSLPVNWLLALPLDLWLTLFNLVYNKQKALGLKVCARAEPCHN